MAQNTCTCRGSNYTITLSGGQLILEGRGLGAKDDLKMPMDVIRSLVIERKPVVPFAVTVVISAIAAAILWYNSLWFLFNLPSTYDRTWLSVAAIMLCGLSAIPMLSRIAFVNVIISWEGATRTLQVNYVPTTQGRRLAKEFRELSVESMATQDEQSHR